VTDKSGGASHAAAALPPSARLPLNRCNLPAAVLGGLTFNAHPCALTLDGVHALHRPLFTMLDDMDEAQERRQGFVHYMAEHFSLGRPEDAGLASPGGTARPPRRRGGATPGNRARAMYLRVVRGWLFDPDGREGAVLKGWVESRFGLVPRFHREPLRDPGSAAYSHYLGARAAGLYGTNALEEQLDLLYTFCQYELARQGEAAAHRTLYRGVNALQAYEEIAALDSRRRVLLLNNLNSFSSSRERAGEFGDYILTAAVPLPKIFFFSRLLPGMPRGEDEFVVIGGLYEVGFATV